MIAPTYAARSNISRHKCLIYDGSPAEQLPVIIPFLASSLNQGWRCLYLGSPEFIQLVGAALAAHAIDVSAEVRNGALIFSSDRAQPDAGFEPQALIAMLDMLIGDAVRRGFVGLCAVGDMAWELGAEEHFDRLVEYEAALDAFFQTRPLRGICLYHASMVPVHGLQGALLTHQNVYLGEELNCDNFFYLPPGILGASAADRDAQSAWMCAQIIRVQDAERQRDDAIAAQKRSEVAQAHLASELAATNRDMTQQIQQRTSALENANAELTAFSHSVAHDLRSQLWHLDHYVQKLHNPSEVPLPPHAAAWLDRISASATQMKDLLNALLRLAIISAQELHYESVDLSQLAESIVHQLREEAPARQADWAIQAGMRTVGDPALLRSVLENLLGNAWKFTSKRAHAQIAFTMIPQDDASVFCVADNGAGFAESQSARLFGVFQRLHTQDEFGGTGVGLSIVQRIIQRHGGQAWATGALDAGAAFFFSLPAAEQRLSGGALFVQ